MEIRDSTNCVNEKTPIFKEFDKMGTSQDYALKNE